MTDLTSSQKSKIKFLREVADLIEDGDPEEDIHIYIREAELHKLTAAHAELTALVNGIEGELTYRIEHEDKLAAGSEANREYALRVAEDRL